MENQYAVNVSDLTFIPELLRQLLFGSLCRAENIIYTNTVRVDSGAVVMECEDERAKAIMATIPMLFRHHEQPRQSFIRFYHKGPRGGWKEQRVSTKG